MPIPQDHTTAVLENKPQSQSGESPYKFIAKCSCGFQALGFTQDMATYYGKKHVALKASQGHLTKFVEFVPVVVVVEKAKA